MPIVSHELMEIAKILGLYKAEINCINILHFTQINQYPTVSINYCDTVSIIK